MGVCRTIFASQGTLTTHSGRPENYRQPSVSLHLTPAPSGRGCAPRQSLASCQAPAFRLYYWKYAGGPFGRCTEARHSKLPRSPRQARLSPFRGPRPRRRPRPHPIARRRLAEDTPEASELRAVVSSSIAGAPPQPGGILAALRRSPLVGADLDLSRSREQGRKVDL